MLILRKLVEVTEGAFERKMRANRENQSSAYSEIIREKLKRPLFNSKTIINTLKDCLTKEAM